MPPSDLPNESNAEPTAAEDSTYRISARPVIEPASAARDAMETRELPRTYGTQTLCLLARDPHTLFVYWDIDWEKAFREAAPRNREVHVRLINEDGSEQTRVAIEPMAGSCYITVPNADAAYAGEIGYFDPAEQWTALASSELTTTPPEALSEKDAPDFATVPFHLAFQHMVDLLRISKQENESLTAMLADLRARAAVPQPNPPLTSDQRELAQVVEAVATENPPTSTDAQTNIWTRKKVERILGFGTSSPTNGFGGGGS